MAGLAARASRINSPVLFICDIQEKFREHIYEFSKVVSTSQKLLRASTALNIPVYVTTQNKARLGDTVPELLKYLPSDSSAGNTLLGNVDKMAFSMYTPDILTRLQQQNTQKDIKTIDAILTGIETHICVTQTTLDLLSAGHRVYIIADGVSSVNAEERGIALNRLRDAGAIVTTSESVVFEVLRDAGANPAFKGVNALIKETKEDTREAVRVLCKY
ncbi:hypothetical protein UA08_03604 [Talaromyces atroroseus]|uniref:Isochorismatase-like domain-containing protein n=1 Tax=Talaromyces atroroseus TaxID=1441469 RepID=A0A225AIB6_TALAT|nr:hypothetical protein UA08_03604 [Talaromyces atroroseus]OKL61181.1 hypothetical protein UA08_03604 [Talaromyces atroroseus]